MQRSIIIGSIYGYLVCLLAILLFIHSGAGFVSSIFGIASPTMSYGHGHRHPMMGMGGRPGMWAMGGGMRGMRGGNAPGRWMQGGIAQNPAPMTGASAAPGAGMTENPRAQARTAMLGRARLQAVRAFFVNLVLLIIAIWLFRWHWSWLQRAQPA